MGLAYDEIDMRPAIKDVWKAISKLETDPPAMDGHLLKGV